MKITDSFVNVIGAGLAGCEAAWQIAKSGVHVKLYEMKPQKFSPAHHSNNYAELVCSNSFRSGELSNAIGLLKAELSKMGSLIMHSALKNQVPAGGALAVNRESFSQYITEQIRSNPFITIISEEVVSIPQNEITIIATGPLTSNDFAIAIRKMIGNRELYFYDAAAPIIDFSTINTGIAYFASRYGKGNGYDYLNCPMTKDQYDLFYEELISAKEADLKEFDCNSQADLKVFEGCMPVEVMARRGYDTLRYGPLKPVGLPMPNGEEAYAVVQLRRENTEGSMYNLVGFQTHLTFGEQQRVFRLIPGLENAEFLRYGVMHRNTYINSPGLLTPTYSMAVSPKVFFAGQITGVEGYIESAASGFIAGLNAARMALGEQEFVFSRETMIGAMSHYVSDGNASGDFQPMNANFGIIAPLGRKIKGGKRARNLAYSERSLAWIDEHFKEIK